MKKISFFSDVFVKNACFEVDGPYNRDGFLNFFVSLKDEFAKKGYDLSTSDLNKVSSAQALIFNESPANIEKYHSFPNKLLLSLESPLFNKRNSDVMLHENYTKVFTWNDSLIDNKRYFKVNYAFTLPNHLEAKSFSGKKLVCVIAGHKKSSFPNELYSEREKAIKWYQEHAPEDFDLYGIGWDKYQFSVPFLSKVLNRLVTIRTSEFSSYKGKVESKHEVMRNYKFAICYENIYGDSGYITEKFFDAMVAGCIPVYLGAPNIKEYVPEECFIDKRDFGNYSELHDFLRNMSQDEYFSYLEAIDAFFKSAKSNSFRAEFFAKTVVDEVLKEIDG